MKINKFIVAAGIAVLLSTQMTLAAETEISEQKQYLPEKGDFALGVDIVPLLKTIGGAFDKNESVPVGGAPFEYTSMYLKPNVSVIGKYMLSDKWGLKANIGIAVRKNEDRSYVSDDLGIYLDPNSGAKVVDNRTTTQSGGSLTFGAEYRVGQRRVQGLFGFGILAGFSTYRTTYGYGNKITDFNRTPTNSFGEEVTSGIPSGYRVTEARSEGPNIAVGIYGSAGIEWFVAPKIALGAEVDLYLYSAFASKGVVKSEGYNVAYQRIDNRTDLVTPGNRAVEFGTDNIGGSLYVTFYF